MTKKHELSALDMARMGGEAVLKQRGREYYSALGKKGMAHRWAGHVRKTPIGLSLVLKCPACQHYFKANYGKVKDIKCPNCTTQASPIVAVYNQTAGILKVYNAGVLLGEPVTVTSTQDFTALIDNLKRLYPGLALVTQ